MKESHVNPIILSLKSVKKSFSDGEGSIQALKGISLDVHRGEILVILGKSGCGKTTLLNIIGGIERCTEGSIIFDGQELSVASEKRLTRYRRNNIGYVFQNYHLMSNLDVKKNIQLMAELVRKPLDINDVLRKVDLFDKKDNYPAQLSGGQQQRVSIARALVKNPAIILADEPTAALDYATSISVLSVIEEIHNAGTTIIMVTHNEQIAKMADRIVYIRDGLIDKIIENTKPLKAKELEW